MWYYRNTEQNKITLIVVLHRNPPIYQRKCSKPARIRILRTKTSSIDFCVPGENGDGSIDLIPGWKINKCSFSYVAKLACVSLAVTSSSVPSESAFSDAGNIIAAERTRHSDETFRACFTLTIVAELVGIELSVMETSRVAVRQFTNIAVDYIHVGRVSMQLGSLIICISDRTGNTTRTLHTRFRLVDCHTVTICGAFPTWRLYE